MEVAILLHEGVAAAEAVGPFAVLRRVPDVTVRFVAVVPGRYLAHDPPLELEAPRPVDWVPHPDVVLIPGGFGAHELSHDEIAAFGGHPVSERVVEHGKIITAMGGLGAIDLALRLAGHLAPAAIVDDLRASIGIDP